MKAGIKSTEFWMVIVGIVITVLNDVAGLNLDKESLMALLGTVIAYVGSRSYLKAQPQPVAPVVTPQP